MNIYEEASYRKIIKHATAERKEVDSEVSFQAMATFMGIQKSYLSKVLGGNADLNHDQLFMACRYLRFDERQSGYMALLLEHERSGIKPRKEILSAQIQSIQEQHRETKEHLKAPKASADIQGISDYYLDPLNQLVHICLSIPRYRTDPSLIARDLNVGPKRLSGSLDQLEKLRIISREAKNIRILIEDVHLPRESQVYRAWRNSVKLLILKRLDELETKSAYNFAVTFSANEEARRKIHARFLDFLKQVESIVKSAPSEDAYQMSFDLLPWTKN